MAFVNPGNDLFFMPFMPADHHAGDYAPSKPDLIPPSKNWDRGFFSTKELRAPYYVARAPIERAIVIGCSGLNTHTLLRPSDVKKLNDAGISIIWMALPKIPPGSPIMDTYLPLAREFFTNKNSPARVLLNGDVPRYALTHSTGGQLFYYLLHEPDTNRKLCYTFSGAVHVTPYFDTSHASRDHSHPLVQAAFKKYMSLQPDMAPNKRLIGKAYVKWNDYLDPSANINHLSLDSTCGQILQLQESGQRLTAKDHFNAEACKKLHSIFVIGDKDNFACPKTSIDIGTSVGAEIEMAEGGFHDPLRTHPHLLDVFIGKMDECVKQYEAKKAERIYVSPTPAPLELEPIPYGMIDRLRDSTRLALQSRAGALNSFASFF